jgi:hypothetical protein
MIKMLNQQRTIGPEVRILSKGTLWRNAAIAAIATASLWLPVISVAQPGQGGQEMPGAGMPHKKHVVKHKVIYDAARTPSTGRRTYGASPDAAYHSYFTLPQEDPPFFGGG